MDKMIKECTKPHALSHWLSGAGIGLIVLALVPSLVAYALVLGVILLIGGVAWDLMVNPSKKT